MTNVEMVEIVLRERISERICGQIVAVLVRISAFCADTARSEFLLYNVLSCGVVVPILLS